MNRLVNAGPTGMTTAVRLLTRRITQLAVNRWEGRRFQSVNRP
jgi:hypothetical protein